MPGDVNPVHFKTFFGRRPYDEAVEQLKAAGWVKREYQAGGDFEDFIHSDGSPGLLLVDVSLGRFILDKDGSGVGLLNHVSKADGDPAFDAILNALFRDERHEGEGAP